jgi:hypothetical protein
MKHRYTLLDTETNEIFYYGTLKEMEEKLKIPYHQIRSVLHSDKKVFLHPNIKNLATRYKITNLK